MVDRLLQAHRQALSGIQPKTREFLGQLASSGQSPDAAYVGCSDSRVVPELLTDSSPGSLFVIRNVANIVPVFEHADASVGAALEYAVAQLEVPHLIVCGHYGCGGIKGVMAGRERLRDLPSLYEWLAGAQEAVDATREMGIHNEEAWFRAAVRENVVVQLMRLATYPTIGRAISNERLELHGWVYDLHSLDLEVYDWPTDTFLSATQVLSQKQHLEPAADA